MNVIAKMLQVYFIAGTQDCCHLNGQPEQNLLSILQQALAAGISCFQFRDKGAHSLMSDPARQKQLALACRDLCRQYRVPFIVNDDIDLALEIEADGIHVGQKDQIKQALDARTSRSLIVGLSINNIAQCVADKDTPNIDYFGLGPIFATQSKADHAPVLSPAFIRDIRLLGVNKPCVAIGGITTQNARQLRQLGADGVAVISAITQAADIASAVKQLQQ